MTDNTVDKQDVEKKAEFENLEVSEGVVAEFCQFLKENKKFWLAPIIIVLLLMGLLIFAGGTAAAPFIYTLF